MTTIVDIRLQKVNGVIPPNVAMGKVTFRHVRICDYTTMSPTYLSTQLVAGGTEVQ